MEEQNIILCNIDTLLLPGKKYKDKITEIEFIYDIEGCKEKPFLLNNGYRLNHYPIKADKCTNNLISLNSRTKEERKKISSAGGVKSAQVQAQRRTFKDSLNMILSCKASQEEIDGLPLELQQLFKNTGIIPTKEDLINIRAVELAIIGSDKHAVFARDSVGEKPTDKQELTAEVITPGDAELLNKIADRLNIE